MKKCYEYGEISGLIGNAMQFGQEISGMNPIYRALASIGIPRGVAYGTTTLGYSIGAGLIGRKLRD